MMRLFAIVLLACTAQAARAEEPAQTEVVDQKELAQVLGTHKLALQWISWKRFGKATVTDAQGLLRIEGRQDGDKGNFLEVSGVFSRVAAGELTFQGKITTRVDHINQGNPCVREGTFTFKRSGKRRYWRMYPFDNPCDEAADYVDLFLR
jgi:hypothetical protein